MRLSNITHTSYSSGRTVSTSGNIVPSDKGTIVYVNTTAGPVTLAMPPAPTINDTYHFLDLNNTWTSNNVTLATNKYFGRNEEMTLDITGGLVSAVYRGPAIGWSVGLDQPIIDNATMNQLVSSFATNAVTETNWISKIHPTTLNGNVTLDGTYTDTLVRTDTSVASFAINLNPDAVPGDTVGFIDIAGTWDTNPLLINTSMFAGAAAAQLSLNLERFSVVLKYVDSTFGWTLMD